MIRVIQISDLHFEAKALDYDRKRLFDALLEDLKSWLATGEELVTIPGDLVEKGGLEPDFEGTAYDVLETEFLERLFKQHDFLRTRTFIVPGNHDVNRDSTFPYFKNGIMEKAGIGYSEVMELQSKESGQSAILVQMKTYSDFKERFYEGFKDVEVTPFEVSAVLSVDGKRIGISCLDSSWFGSEGDRLGDLILGQCQVQRSLDYLKDTDLKLAVFHHPLEHLWIEDRRRVEPLLHKHYKLILNGHSHSVRSFNFQDIYGCSLVSISQSTLGKKPSSFDYYTGYTIVDVYPGDKYEVHYRKYRWEHGDFVDNTDIAPESGKKTFPGRTANRSQNSFHQHSL